ncbi:unnamed protein product [Meloidogyne enterolobii]|uniref:Uncharacterized protein n=1 Tax=Meloidogyne enterolobii TaxID=390850 RepID=A0ACB0ZQ25_MELEN
MLFKNILFIFLILFFIQKCFATFSSSFREFLKSYGGEQLDRELSREDVGAGGSFGGGNHKVGEQTRHEILLLRPVIIVHGITNSAGQFEQIRQYFLTHGYGDEEVYATTYGDAGKTNVLFVTMQCHYVKMIRLMIQTVAQYTTSKVNIIGISMGSPIARKAIMGGNCVDTNDHLGPPLTDLIHTFVGVAGANWGSFLCIIPIGSCNLINGMACGSKFLNDINSRQRYEGNFIFTIFSTGDEKVGYQACGRVASSIAGENQNFKHDGLNHDQVIFNTAAMQYNLVTYGQPQNP